MIQTHMRKKEEEKEDRTSNKNAKVSMSFLQRYH